MEWKLVQEMGGAIIVLGAIMGFLGKVIFKTNAGCEKSQEKCQGALCDKLDKISNKLATMETNRDRARNELSITLTAIATHIGRSEQYMKDHP